jgi:hypothetical protein
VEHGGDTDASAEMFGIGGDRENGLARCLEQQIVDHRFILISEVSDRRRQREDDVEVSHRQELGLALGEPLLCCCGLAFVAMPIAARVICDPRITAVLVLAAFNMATERSRAAALDRTHHLQLAEAQKPITTRHLNRLFHEAADAAGIRKQVTLHTLRHYLPFRIMSRNAVFARFDSN